MKITKHIRKEIVTRFRTKKIEVEVPFWTTEDGEEFLSLGTAKWHVKSTKYRKAINQYPFVKEQGKWGDKWYLVMTSEEEAKLIEIYCQLHDVREEKIEYPATTMDYHPAFVRLLLHDFGEDSRLTIVALSLREIQELQKNK